MLIPHFDYTFFPTALVSGIYKFKIDVTVPFAWEVFKCSINLSDPFSHEQTQPFIHNYYYFLGRNRNGTVFPKELVNMD